MKLLVSTFFLPLAVIFIFIELSSQGPGFSKLKGKNSLKEGYIVDIKKNSGAFKGVYYISYNNNKVKLGNFKGLVGADGCIIARVVGTHGHMLFEGKYVRVAVKITSPVGTRLLSDDEAQRLHDIGPQGEIINKDDIIEVAQVITATPRATPPPAIHPRTPL